MRQRRLLVALDDRRILVDRRDPLRLPLLRIPLGDPPHRPRLHILQALHRSAAGHNEALLLLPRRAQRFQFLIVKALQKPPHRRRLGRPIPQAPFQTGILGEQPNVLRTVPADGLQQR